MTIQEKIKDELVAYDAMKSMCHEDVIEEIVGLIQSEIKKAIPKPKGKSVILADESMIKTEVAIMTSSGSKDSGYNEAISELRTNLQKVGLLKG